jgi:hypothetical protein
MLLALLLSAHVDSKLVVRLVMQDDKLQTRAVPSFPRIEPVLEETAPVFRLRMAARVIANHAPSRVLVFLEPVGQTSLVQVMQD